MDAKRPTTSDGVFGLSIARAPAAKPVVALRSVHALGDRLVDLVVVAGLRVELVAHPPAHGFMVVVRSGFDRRGRHAKIMAGVGVLDHQENIIKDRSRSMIVK